VQRFEETDHFYSKERIKDSPVVERTNPNIGKNNRGQGRLAGLLALWDERIKNRGRDSGAENTMLDVAVMPFPGWAKLS
jgi:hypothetical protein